MASEYLIAWFETIASIIGSSAEAWLYIFAVIIALSVGIAVVRMSDKKEIGFPVFMLVLLLETMLGAFEWHFFVLIMLLVLAFYYYSHKGGSEE